MVTAAMELFLSSRIRFAGQVRISSLSANRNQTFA